MKINVSFLIVTFFGIGKSPIMPGTIGSLVAFPLYFILMTVLIIIKGGVSNPLTLDMTQYLLFIDILLFFIGILASAHYEKDIKRHDPKEIIIDEIVGQLFTIINIVAFLPYVGEDVLSAFKKIGIDKKLIIYVALTGAFIFFRLFDILKPWPINYVDTNIKSGLGIMLDDICAGIMAFVSFYFLLYAISDLIHKFFS